MKEKDINMQKYNNEIETADQGYDLPVKEETVPTPPGVPEEGLPDTDPGHANTGEPQDTAETEESTQAAITDSLQEENLLPEPEMEKDGSPSDELFTTFVGTNPQQRDELIYGILRKGFKMLIAGPSKARKSFLLMELAIALAAGAMWLGFKCRKSRVLYVNLEIDRIGCIIRLQNIFDSLGVETKPENTDYLGIWNLRGKAKPLDDLLPALITRLKRGNYDVVIIDPIYKIITGDENNATDMSYFTNQFDRICDETGCAVVYCHHHSKGKQGSKNMMDRSSGSGVFGRDPDTIMDICPLQIPEAEKVEGVTAWRMEFVLRDFPDANPINVYFKYPIHTVDTSGKLAQLPVEGSIDTNLSKSPKRTTAAGRREALADAFRACQEEGSNGLVTVSDMADFLGCTEKTIRAYIRECAKEYEVSKGIVSHKSAQKTQ